MPFTLLQSGVAWLGQVLDTHDESVVVERLVSGFEPDGFGVVDASADGNWEPFFTIDEASLRPEGGSEPDRGGQTTPIQAWRLRCADTSNTRAITTAMRVRWGTRILNILNATRLPTQIGQVELQLKEAK